MAALALVGQTGMAQETWDGGSTPINLWSSPGNWADDSAPANPYAGTVWFNNIGLGTNVLDQSWVVRSLFYTNSSLAGSHVTDLGGFTLTLSNSAGGQLVAGYSTSNTAVTLRNGNLQLGAAGAPADLYAGWNKNLTVNGGPSMKGVSLTISATLDAANLRHLAVTKDDDGSWPGASRCESSMDLSSAAISSKGIANKLSMSGNLTVGGPKNNWDKSGTGLLKLPAALTALDVGGYVVIGEGPAWGRGTLDFGAGSLLNSFSVSNDFRIGGMSGKGWLVNWPTGVHVRVGNAAAPVRMLLGNCTGYELPSGAYGALTLTNGSFTAYFSQVKFAGEDYANMSGSTGILDLTQCPSVQIGNKPNEVHLPEIRLAANASFPGQGSHGYGRLSLPGSVTNVQIGDFAAGGGPGMLGILEFAEHSQLKAFSVTNSFVLGFFGRGEIRGLSTIGLQFTIGSSQKPIRMDMGCGTAWTQPGYAPEGRIILTNGSFAAYVTNLRLGDRNGGQSSIATGELDLTNSTLVAFNVQGNANVGYNAAGHNNNGNRGYLRLPAGTMNIASNFYIGDVRPPYGVDEGLVELRGTRVNVGQSIHILQYGKVAIDLKGESGGLDLASSDTNNFTISAGGLLAITVQADPNPALRSYWGLRMAGDQQAYFQSLTNSGQVTVNTSAMSAGYAKRFGIHYDGSHTILGVAGLSPGTLISIH